MTILGIKEKKIDGLVPVTKEDFEQFGKAISEKIQMFSSSEHYSELIENITKEICIDRKLLTLVISWLWGIKVECSDLSLNQVCYFNFFQSTQHR